jgi:hypothetical protein
MVYFSRQVGNTPPSYGGELTPPSQWAAISYPHQTIYKKMKGTHACTTMNLKRKF